MNRFIAIIEDPGRIWTNHAVVDTTRNIRLCSCSDSHNADMIASCLNVQFRERFAKLIGNKTDEPANHQT